MLEPDEIEDFRLPSSDTLALDTFVDLQAIDIARFERPYFVMPQGRDAREIYAVMQKPLMDSGKAGLGQIAMRGREELCALYALMLSTLRYDAELEHPQDALPGTIKKAEDGFYRADAPVDQRAFRTGQLRKIPRSLSRSIARAGESQAGAPQAAHAQISQADRQSGELHGCT